jgi:FAD/FMN-containing dehydrogenase
MDDPHGPTPTAPREHTKTTRRAVLGSAAAAGLAYVGAKIYEYSAPPSAPKTCDFAYPPEQKIKLPGLSESASRASIGLAQSGGFINDASCLNRTPIFGIAEIHTVDDIRRALQTARENKLKVTVAGQHHSMGGQSFARDGLVLDMRNWDQIRIDKHQMIANVQSGAIWAQLQTELDHEALSVLAMQSINVFSIGGSLSVNAHGIAHRPGPVASTVKSLRMMLASGEIVTATSQENAELFRLVLGGYGLFGVILDADLEITRNAAYQLQTRYMDYREFPEYYQKNVAQDENIELMFGRISISPTSYLRETALHTYSKTAPEVTPPFLKPEKHEGLARFVFNFSKTGSVGRWMRWTLEKRLEPVEHDCVPRNQALTPKDACLVSRNQEMYDSMGFLRNRLHDTDILQEYFIPYDQMPSFIDGLRNTVTRNGANLLNVTIRVVHKDRVTALPYAKRDMFAFVLYFNQDLNETASKILRQTTIGLIDLAIRAGGTFYLPYQLYYSGEQLRAAYPEIDRFFAAKKKYDPDSILSNKFFEKYAS